MKLLCETVNQQKGPCLNWIFMFSSAPYLSRSDILRDTICYLKYAFCLFLMQDLVNIKVHLRDIDTETRFQPFILGLIHDEASQLQPASIFVAVERQVMPQPTLLRALDICYRIHYVFDCKYQQGCRGVWTFFGTCV